MEIIKGKLPGLLKLKPKLFNDGRGYFYESFNKQRFIEQGIESEFVQDNQSMSNKGVLRGLHFQNPPFAQGKLVRVINGAVLDVAVDIRLNSPTYGQWESIELTEENKMMYWIPVGFAHGFLTLRNNTILAYKCTQYYDKASEGSILWNDPDLNINWNIVNPILSQKDKQARIFENFVCYFNYEGDK